MEAYVDEVRKLESALTVYKRSTFPERRATSLITCQSVLHLSYLWNQVPFCFG